MSTYGIPVLITSFNRPEKTEQVINALRKIQPEKIYFAVDGARNPGEEARVNETRKLINNIDWPCQVSTRFSDINQGCAHGVVNAVTWAFEQEEFLVVLEDDILPSKNFFEFTNFALENVLPFSNLLAISGTNFVNAMTTKCHSARLSNFMHSWGWATSKQVWMEFRNSFFEGTYTPSNWKLFKALGYSIPSFIYMQVIILEIKKNRVDSWAFPFVLFGIQSNRKSLISNSNLTINIGIDVDATHTNDSNQIIPTKFEPIEKQVSICYEVENRKFDREIVKNQFMGSWESLFSLVCRRIFQTANS